jgi:hypothetical protein
MLNLINKTLGCDSFDFTNSFVDSKDAAVSDKIFLKLL